MLLRSLRQSKGLALAWIGWAEMRAQPGRALLAAAAIAIGVALGFAVHLVNASALNEFARAVQAETGEGSSITAAGKCSAVRISGPLPASSDENLAGMDIAIAQWSSGTPVLLHRING